MNSERRIQSLIEMERPFGHRGPEEVKRFVHLNDNMVRRVTSVLDRNERQTQRKA